MYYKHVKMLKNVQIQYKHHIYNMSYSPYFTEKNRNLKTTDQNQAVSILKPEITGNKTHGCLSSSIIIG